MNEKHKWTEMVTRVTIAIEKFEPDGSYLGLCGGPEDGEVCDLGLLATRVIEAMREPTDSMVFAGWQAASNMECDTPKKAQEVGRTSYTAMIDAAINDKEMP